MLTLLPVFILILGGGVILVSNRSQTRVGYMWLLALFFSLAAWISILILRWHMPVPVYFSNWIPASDLAAPISFNLDFISWGYSFALITIILVVILTASARLQDQGAIPVWAGSMGITSIGLLAIMAGTPLTLILAWTILDIIEMVTIFTRTGDETVIRRAIIAFVSRVAGTFVLLWATMIVSKNGQPLVFTKITSDVGGIVLLAAGLRLGVVPLHVPYHKEVLNRRGIGTIIRLVSPASSLALLGHAPVPVVQAEFQPILLFFALLAALYGAFFWLFSKDEIDGRPFWLIAFAGITIACVLKGQPGSTLGWGIIMLLSGALLFLFSARERSILAIPILAGLNIFALPFTPAASSWLGLSYPLDFYSVSFILVMVLLFIGYLKYAFQPGESLALFDRWIQVVYPIGLFFLIVSEWIIGIWGWDGSFTMGVWWAGGASFFLGMLAFVFGYRPIIRIVEQGDETSWVLALGNRIGTPLGRFFHLDWLYALFARLFDFIEGLVNRLTGLLEGDGGVLWGILFLIILISLLFLQETL